MTQEEIERRFAEIDARQPEKLTLEEEASLATAEAMDDGTRITYEELRAELLAIEEARRAGRMKGYTVEEVLAYLDAKFKEVEAERMENELDRIAYAEGMAAYQANPVTYTTDQIERMLEAED